MPRFLLLLLYQVSALSKWLASVRKAAALWLMYFVGLLPLVLITRLRPAERRRLLGQGSSWRDTPSAPSQPR